MPTPRAPKGVLYRGQRQSKWRDRTGERQGRLTITGWAGYKNGHSYWNCTCNCGRTIVSRAGAEQKSCGCLAAEVQKTGRSLKKMVNGELVNVRSRMVEIDGKQYTLEQAARRHGLDPNTVLARINEYKWPRELWFAPVFGRTKPRIRVKVALPGRGGAFIHERSA